MMFSKQATSSKRKLVDSDEDDPTKNIRADTYQTATSSKRKLVDSDESKDGASKNIRTNSPDIFVDKPNEYHSSIGLKNTLHGSIYQLKLLMLFVNMAIKNNYQFRLATEMDAAEKFDDLVFQFKPKGQDKIAHRFLQAKHKQDESKKITYNDLVSENDNDFSLKKYFNSFRRIKQNIEFEGHLQDFIICTNINLDFAELKQKHIKTIEITGLDDFFPSYKDKLAARYKLILDEQNELYKILKKTSDIHMLAKELSIGIKEKKQLNLKSSIIKSYHKALVKENIIVIEKTNNEYIGKFNDTFIKYNFKYPNDPNNDTGLSDSAKKLREILQEYLEIKGLSLNKDTQLKLSSTFGKGFELDSDPQLINIREFSKEIVKLVKDAKNNVITIDGRHYKPRIRLYDINVKYIANNISKLAGHVLIIKNEKIQFRESFLDGSIQLPGNLKEFKDSLKIDLQKQGLNLNDLTQYQLKIGGDFTTCEEEEELQAKAVLPHDNIEDKVIKEFFEKLVFAVNQPNEDQLSYIIELEMGKNYNFNLLNAGLVIDSFEIKMLNWFKLKGQEKNKEGTWISNENAQIFFDSIKNQINTLISVGFSLKYIAKLEGYGIEFKNENLALKHFLSSNDSTKIFNLINSKVTILSAITVLQTLKHADFSDRYKQQDSYSIMRLKTVVLPNIQQCVIEAFKSNYSHNLLVIDCSSKVTEPNTLQELFTELSAIINNSKNHMKKLILITKENDDLAKKFETDLTYKDKYEKSEADFTRLTDLTQSSQVMLLEKPIVWFQGENIRLISLIDKSDEKSKQTIKSEILLKLITNKDIKIGNKIKGLGHIKDYYIPRRIYAQEVTFNTEKLKEYIKNNGMSDFLVISGTNSGLPGTNHIFLFDNSNYESACKKFQKLCEQNKESNIHWLKSELGKLILHESQGSISSLVKHREIKECHRIVEDETSENVFTEKKYLEKNNSKILLIADSPGMGKSTLLTSLSLEIKTIDCSIWVIRIDLNDYTTVFAKEIENRNFFSKSNVNKVADFLLDILLASQEESKLTTNFEKDLFKNYVTGQGKILFLFDGFDEISPDYQDVVIDILQALNKTKVNKIFVTTRPNMRGLLENKLEVFSDILKPFSKQDQIEFLTKFWIKKLDLQNLNEERKNRLHTYADSLIEKFSKSIDDKAKEFIGIPLQTMMLAEIFQETNESKEKKFGGWETCKEFIASDNTDMNPKLPAKFNLPSLYEHFVKKKFYNFHLEAKQHIDFSKVSAKNNAEENYENFIKRHSIMALSVLLDDKNLNKLLSETERQELNRWIKDIEEVKKNEGIIDKILNNKPHFIHRTFAEYFASFALVEKQDLKPRLVCAIVDKMITNTSPVFLSKIFDLQDNLCNTILHHAVKYNKEYIIESALKYKNDILENDILMHGVFKNKKYENSNIVKFVNKKNNQGKTALDYAEHSKLDLKHAFKLLLKGANIDGLTQEYRNKLTKYMLHTQLDDEKDEEDEEGSYLTDKFAYEYHRFRPIQEKFLMTSPEKFRDLHKEYKPRLLSYFFVHGRVKVIDTLLSSIKDEKERTWLFNAECNLLTPLDLVNGSDFINDDERLEITKYLLENGGIKVKKVIGLSDKSLNSYITTILQAAAQYGHIKTFKYFIHLETCTYYNLYFSLAVKNQQFNTVEYLIVNYKKNIKYKGNTPLHIAVKSEGNLKIIKYCIDNEEEINAKNNKGETPLFHAIYNRRLSAVKYLVERGADVDIEDKQNYTVLNRAIEQDDRDIINFLLLKCKAKINFTSELIRNKIEFFKNLNEFNFDIDNQNDMCRLHCAIQLKEPERAKFIIQNGADINLKDLEGKTPLHWASDLQQTETVETLLQYGAIFDSKDINNSTPFDLVSKSGNNKITWLLNVLKKLFSSQNLMQTLGECLLKAEKNSHLKDWGPYGCGYLDVWSSDNPMLFILNGKNAEGNTLIHIAAETNDQKALNILLNFNYAYTQRRENPQSDIERRYKYYQSISIDAVDSLGNTPLHLAAQKGNEKVADLLLKKGSIFNARNLQGKTPEDLATNNQNNNITELMQATKYLFIAIEQRDLLKVKSCINNEAYINAKSINGRTPLHFAVASDQSEIVINLLNESANTNALDMHNRTPLHLATENNNIEIVKLLLKYGAIFNAKDKWNKAPYEFEYNQCVNLLNAIKILFNYINSDNPEVIIDYIINVIEKDFKLDIGTIFNIRDNQCNNILHYAAKSNDIKIAEFLFKSGAYALDKIKDMLRSFRHTEDIFSLLYSFENMFKNIDYIYQEHKTVSQNINMHVFFSKKNEMLHKILEYNKYLVKRLLRSGAADVNYIDSNSKSLLCLAAEKGMLETAKLLIECGAEVNPKLVSPLFCCVEKGIIEMVKFLIECGADYSEYNNYYQGSLIQYFVQNNKLESVKILVEHGADVNVEEDYKSKLLHTCAKQNCLEIADFLIEHGADVQCKDYNGSTPLNHCAENGMLDLAKLLIEKGADVNCTDLNDDTPLIICAEKGGFAFARFLIEQGADVKCKNRYGRTPLYYCAQNGMLDFARFLIEQGVDVKCKDSEGETLLHCSIENKRIEFAKYLIEQGADIECIDHNGKTPLHYCAEQGMLDLAKFLIEQGANVGCIDHNGKTPLHYCAEKGMLDLAKFLIEQGADVKCIDNESKTLMHYCIGNREIEFAKYLIEQGADIECIDHNGKTPLHYCAEQGMLDLAKFLIEQGANVGCIDHKGETLLHYCAKKGMLHLAKSLIEQGADVGCIDHNGKTPLHYCAEKGMLDLAKFLIEQGADVKCIDNESKTLMHYCIGNRRETDRVCQIFDRARCRY